MKLDVIAIASKTVSYTPVSQLHSERVQEISTILYNFSPTWGLLLVHLYPIEVRLLLKKFEGFHFEVVDEEPGLPTIHIGISRMLH